MDRHSRHGGRSRALQCLYAIDLTGYDRDEVLEAFWEMMPTKPGQKQYATQLVKGVCDEAADLDARIAGAVESWNPERIGTVERASLRIALFEMLHMEDVPARVAINEAIEVVKEFGNDEAPRFVNGVLDRLRRQLEDEPV